jgi:uncharacterized membrane protein
VAAVLLALCEVAFASDVFGSRLNTVFKLYYQAWPLLACASAYGLVYVGRLLLWAVPVAVRVTAGPVWLAAVALLFAGTLVYTVTAPQAKTNRFANAPTLDGMRWIANIYPGDYAALMWLRRDVNGMPVTVEGYKRTAYDYPGRVGAYTGLPGLMGWENHESQWRGNQPVFGRRENDVEAIYRQSDPASLPSLLQRYDVQYLYYGDVERQLYGDLDPARRQRFADLLGVAYEQNGVTIFGPGLRGVAALPGAR